jgi:formylglycine-generating enzyme required for sulfatase activity
VSTSTRLGYKIRLPTEWEWQQAATGGNPSNEFPWGAQWDPNRANTYESGLNCTTAVGMYPNGASPTETLDMSGNVWEWCLNEYEHLKRTDLSGDARRVVRGGAWSEYQVSARAAYRFRARPDGRDNVWVFGWCVRPPSYPESLITVCRVSGNLPYQEGTPHLISPLVRGR